MRALRLVGVPYSDEIAARPTIEGKTEEDALVACKGLGVGVRKAQQAKKAAAAEEAAKKAVDAARQPAAQPASGG